MKNLLVPDFIIPGFAKSGTSSLHDYLNQHPLIKMSTIKEPHNYSDLERFKNRFDSTSKFSYNNLFGNPSDKNILLGESSTSYAICDYSAELIYKDNPNMKFIFIARDPIERIRSHYNWLLSLGQVNKDFRSEIEDWLYKKFDINNPVEYGYKYYTQSSFYGQQLKVYFNYFNRSNFHFLSTENLNLNPTEELNKCFRFLNLPEYSSINFEKSNKTNALKTYYNIPKPLYPLKKIIPFQYRATLKKLFGKKYLIENKHMSLTQLNTMDVAWLTDILNQDIDLFKKLTANDFKEWKHF